MKTLHAVTVLFLLAAASVPSPSQSISIHMRAADNGGHFDTLWFGQDPVASYCVDAALSESTLPPKPVSGVFDVRWVESHAGSTCLEQGMKRDYRPGDDVYRLELQPGYGGFPFTLSWGELSALPSKPVTLTDAIDGSYINVDMKSQASLVITNPAFTTVLITVGTPPPVLLAPSAYTWETTSYSQVSAQLGAGVNPNGDQTNCWFEWGESIAYGETTASLSAGSGTQLSEVTQTITGLEPQTSYHYRIVAQNANGTTYGDDIQFTTIPTGVSGATLLPLYISASNGRSRTLWLGVHDEATYCIDGNLGEAALGPIPASIAFDARFVEAVPPNTCLGAGTVADFRDYLGADHGDRFKISLQPGEDGYPVTLTWPDAAAWFAGSLTLRDILDGTLLSVDMKAQNSVVLTGSAVSSLYILSGDPAPLTATPPIVQTYSALSVTQNAAELTGSANPGGAAATSWFEWGTSNQYGSTTPPQSVGDGDAYVSVTAPIAGLDSGTEYHFRIVAQNSLGTDHGVDKTFRSVIAGTRGVTMFNLNVSDGYLGQRDLWLGVSPGATVCIDEELGEEELPPIPPSGTFDARSLGAPGALCGGTGLARDYRPHLSDVQVDTFLIKFQSGYSGSAMTFSWDNLAGYFSGPARMIDYFGGFFVNVDMTAQTSYTLANPSLISSLLIVTGPAEGVTAIDDLGRLPDRFTLGLNYPNPFNPSTAIEYSLPADSRVVLEVYNVFGQPVATLVDGVRRAGTWTAQWHAGDSPSGVYYCRMTAGSFTQTRKILLVR